MASDRGPLTCSCSCDHRPIFARRWDLGDRRAGDVGVRDRQLRLVDRHRPRRHLDLGDPPLAQAGMADVDQPVRRGDDPVCRGLRRAFPALAPGAPWVFYWLLPYPNTMALWPQWRSPLIWDVFAVSTYATVSLMFWYVGLIPDLATLRDRAKNAGHEFYGFLAMGWRGRRGTGIATAPPTCSWPASRRRWSSRSTRSWPSTSRSQSCRAGTPRSFRPTSSPVPSSRGSRWW